MALREFVWKSIEMRHLGSLSLIENLMVGGLFVEEMWMGCSGRKCLKTGKKCGRMKMVENRGLLKRRNVCKNCGIYENR